MQFGAFGVWSSCSTFKLVTQMLAMQTDVNAIKQFFGTGCKENLILEYT